MTNPVPDSAPDVAPGAARETAAGPVSGALRQLLGDSVIYGLGRMAGYLMGIVLFPLYTHFLTVADYGVLENILVFASLAGALIPLGLPTALVRYWYLAKDDRDRKTSVGTTFATTLLLLVPFVVVFVVFAPELCRSWFADSRAVLAFRIAAVTLFPSSLLILSTTLLKVRFRTVAFGLVSVVQVLLLGAINTWLVAGLHLEVEGVLLGGAVAGTVAAGAGLFLVRHDLAIRLSLSRLRRLLAYGAPLVPSAVAFWAILYADRFLLTRLSGLTEVGLYSAGVRIAGVLFFLNFSVSTAFGPRALSLESQPEARRFFARALTGYLTVAAVLAVFLAAFAREVIMVLAPPAYQDGYRVVAWLTAGAILAGAAHFVTIGIHILKRTHHITWVAVVAAGVNVVLNLLFIPRWGMMGAAAATAAAYAVMTGLYHAVTRVIYPVPFEKGRILRLGLLLGVALVLIQFLDGPGVDGFIRAGIALLFIPCLLVLRIVTFPEVRAVSRMLRRERCDPRPPAKG